MEGPQTRHVQAGGADAYPIVGQGPPDVIYIPGFSHDLRRDNPMSASFPKWLASFSRLILMDRQGARSLAVHIGTKIGAAGPGEVLMSRTVADLVAGSGIKLADRGEHKLKGVPDDWHLVGVPT